MHVCSSSRWQESLGDKHWGNLGSRNLIMESGAMVVKHCTSQCQQLKRSGDLEAATGLADFLQFIMYINIGIWMSINILSDFQPYSGKRRQILSHPCLFECCGFCLCWSMWLAMCMYIVFVCIHACLPIRNLCSPLLLAGPEDKEQQHSHTHQAIGFSNLSHFYCWCCQKQFFI